MSTPRVSIGLPVYNGDNFLRQAIDSIIAQTFSDFELVISDNASTDATEEICRSYAESDSRVVYHRNERNVGLISNFNRVVRLARGEYFHWMAHDDVLAPGYLAACLNALEKNPDAFLVYTRSTTIDENGEPHRIREIRLVNDSPRPHDRWEEAIEAIWPKPAMMTLQYGLMRREVLLKTQLFRNYPMADRIFVPEATLFGRFVEIPEVLFTRRVHPSRVSQQFRSMEDRAGAIDPNLQGKFLFVHWRFLYELLRSVAVSEIQMMEKIACLPPIVKHYVLVYRRGLLGDVKRMALRMLGRS